MDINTFCDSTELLKYLKRIRPLEKLTSLFIRFNCAGKEKTEEKWKE